jgi:hypothetical protein
VLCCCGCVGCAYFTNIYNMSNYIHIMSLKKLEDKICKWKKDNNINDKALGGALVFFVTFWIVLDSVLLGVMFGGIMYIAFNEEEKRRNKNNSKDKKNKK